MSCASGYDHSLFLDHSGNVWSCGNNYLGGLGVVEKIKNLPSITSVSAGFGSSLLLDENGSVWGCGQNGNQQLGLGDHKHRSQPEQIKTLPKIVSAFAGYCSSIFLDCEGSVWSCGLNSHGQLGLGHTTNRNMVEKITGLPKIISISGGSYKALFLDCEGGVWSCGSNETGQLGLGDTTNRNKPEKIVGLPKIISICGGINFSIFVDEERNVWVCGSNGRGELGLGHKTQITKPERNKNLSEIVCVSGGYFASMFLDNQGNVFACGNNEKGQLGLGDKNDRSIPQKVNGIPPISFLSLSTCAYDYFQLVDRKGKVWSCGNNQYGQLGLGDKDDRLTFSMVEALPKLKDEEKKKRKLSAKAAHAKEIEDMKREILILREEKEKHDEIQKLKEEAANKEKKEEAGRRKEREIFKSLTSEQTKEIKTKIVSTMHIKDWSKKEVIVEKIVTGVIGLADWTAKWIFIHERNQELVQSIQQHKSNLSHKQQQCSELQEEIAKIQRELASMEEEKETIEFFDGFLQPIAEAEKELKSGWEEKLQAGKYGEFSVDEVSLFLNVCGIEELIEHQREHKINGEMLEVAMDDISVMLIEDTLTKRKLKFYLKVLQSGKLLNEEELGNLMVWRHKSVEKTLLLLREWEIGLDEGLVRKKGISVCQLIFFKVKDWMKVFGVEWKEAIGIRRKLQGIKKEFKEQMKCPS